MRYYFAPMEGLTDYVYRQLHHKHFGGVDRYYLPFFSPTEHRKLTAREARELPDAHALSYCGIAQIMSKNATDFLWAAQQCRHLGYTEVNLNLGCPSGTVVAKGKGAGMLRDLQALAQFLEEIYANAPLPISIKTRLGLENPEEFISLLEVFNRYPIAELIVHPRVRNDFYKGDVHMELFRFAQANSKNPLCYNGDIHSKTQADNMPVPSVMIGRGLIADPGMLTPQGTTAARLEPFLEELLAEYTRHFGGSRNAMFRLKEHWSYLLTGFENSEKLGKRLRKTTDLQEYRRITAEILHALPRKETNRA